MTYGFVVVAYLILSGPSMIEPIPFATKEACLEAEALFISKGWHKAYIGCVATGVEMEVGKWLKT